MMRTYAIGDIHGNLNKLLDQHALIMADMSLHGAGTIVHVGDLVDRGPDSRGVIQYLMDGMAAGQDWQVLKGNHDRMFSGFLDDAAHHDVRLRTDLSWLHPRLGGGFTLNSYGVENASDRPIAPVHAEAVVAVPASHRAFLAGLPTLIQRGDVVFVHAGIKPGVALDMQVEDDLTWIRDGWLTDTRDHGPLIVHGHTVVDAPTHYGNRVNIDSGAAYGGPLSAVVFEGRDAWHLTDAGRVRLVPVT